MLLLTACLTPFCSRLQTSEPSVDSGLPSAGVAPKRQLQASANGPRKQRPSGWSGDGDGEQRGNFGTDWDGLENET